MKQDDTKIAGTEEKAGAEETPLSRKQIEESSAFKGLLKQHNGALSRLAELEKAQEEAKRSTEEKALLEKNDFEALKVRLTGEIEAERAALRTEKLRMQADLALSKLGIDHEITKEGFLSRYISTPDKERSDIDTWVQGIRDDESNAIFFGKAPVVVGGGPNAKAARNGAGTSIEGIREALASGDVLKAREARLSAKQMIEAGTAEPKDFV